MKSRHPAHTKIYNIDVRVHIHTCHVYIYMTHTYMCICMYIHIILFISRGGALRAARSDGLFERIIQNGISLHRPSHLRVFLELLTPISLPTFYAILVVHCQLNKRTRSHNRALNISIILIRNVFLPVFIQNQQSGHPTLWLMKFYFCSQELAQRL